MKRYEVIEDLQGGTFAMGMHFTANGWRHQALEWAVGDDSYELIEDLIHLPEDDDKILQYIGNAWGLSFRESRDTLFCDLVSIITSDTDVIIKTVDNKILFKYLPISDKDYCEDDLYPFYNKLVLSVYIENSRLIIIVQ